ERRTVGEREIRIAVELPLDVAALLLDAPSIPAFAHDTCGLSFAPIRSVLIEARDAGDLVAPSAEDEDVTRLMMKPVGHHLELRVDGVGLAVDVDLHHHIRRKIDVQEQRRILRTGRVHRALVDLPLSSGDEPVRPDLRTLELILERKLRALGLRQLSLAAEGTDQKKTDEKATAHLGMLRY